MKDIALTVSGARVTAITGQHDGYPARNILESSESFWLSCGSYPQILDISFQGLFSISEIGINSLHVKKVTVLSSSSEKDSKHFQKIQDSNLINGDGIKQDETIFLDASAKLKAKHLRIKIESGYQHFVGIYHVKVMGSSGQDSPITTFSAVQMGIKGAEADELRLGGREDARVQPTEDEVVRVQASNFQESPSKEEYSQFKIPDKPAVTSRPFNQENIPASFGQSAALMDDIPPSFGQSGALMDDILPSSGQSGALMDDIPPSFGQSAALNGDREKFSLVGDQPESLIMDNETEVLYKFDEGIDISPREDDNPNAAENRVQGLGNARKEMEDNEDDDVVDFKDEVVKFGADDDSEDDLQFRT